MISLRTLPTIMIHGVIMLGSIPCEGQPHTFTLNGVVKDRDSHALLVGTTIIATDTLDKSAARSIVSTRADRRGKYKLSLPYDQVYSVEYWAQGHVTKRLIIDLMRTREKDREGGNTMTLEISLFAALAHVDYSEYKVPVAICRFDRKEKKFKWDEDYTKERELALEDVKKQQVAERRSRAAER